jgi:hypothetical protein
MSLRPRRQEHERGEHRKRLGGEIVAEARFEQHRGNCREGVLRICRIGHVGCFKREPPKQCEKVPRRGSRERGASSVPRSRRHRGRPFSPCGATRQMNNDTPNDENSAATNAPRSNGSSRFVSPRSNMAAPSGDRTDPQ